MSASVGTPAAQRVIHRDVADGMATVLRALADPLRLQIVSALATATDGRMPAGEVAGITSLTAPTVSHHLRSLREAGVVVSHRQGTWIFYALAPGMDRVASNLLDALSAAALRSARHGYDGSADDPEAGVPASADAEAILAHACERLAARFPTLDGELVSRTVRESYVGLGRTAGVTQHLPVLAERFATQRLEDIQRVADRSIATARPQVLFVCVANAGRSQLAAALLRKHAGDAVVVRSAGSMPAGDVHATVQPLLVDLLDGLADANAPFPKPLTDDAVRAADVVITMGCGDNCPVLPGKRYEDWAVGDPALASPAGVRAVYDDLETRVRALVADLVNPSAPATNAQEIP